LEPLQNRLSLEGIPIYFFQSRRQSKDWGDELFALHDIESTALFSPARLLQFAKTLAQPDPVFGHLYVSTIFAVLTNIGPDSMTLAASLSGFRVSR
jgi:hypothetical protein